MPQSAHYRQSKHTFREKHTTKQLVSTEESCENFKTDWLKWKNIAQFVSLWLGSYHMYSFVYVGYSYKMKRFKKLSMVSIDCKYKKAFGKFLNILQKRLAFELKLFDYLH